MYIAQEKFKSNIAEYILYMWQIESVIRAYQFDLKKIDEVVIQQLGLDQNSRDNVKAWYADLIKKMKKQALQQKGHLSELQDIVAELSYLHKSLLNNLRDVEYGFLYNNAKPFLKELTQKQDGLASDEIEVALNGLFGFWMLKAAKKPISAETTQAMEAISKLIALLTKKYHEMMGAVNDAKGV